MYIAELLADRLGDAHAAFDEIKTASRLAPQNIRIISRLQNLGEKTERVEEVAVVIGDLIMNQEDPRLRAALSLRLAELNLGPLNDHQRALAYLKAALVDDGGNPEILQGVEDVFRERQRFDELAEVLEECAKDRREGPHRIRLERELARIYELELHDHGRALQALNRALKINAEDRELLDEVMRIGLTGGQLGTVSEIYEWVTASTENALLKTYLRLKLGHIYANVLGQHADAIRVYWAILDEDRTHLEARRRLLTLHEKRDEHEQIARLLELESEDAGDSPDALVHLEQLERLYDGELSEPGQADRVRARIAEIDPDHPSAVPAPAEPTSEAVRLEDVVGTSIVETRSDELPTEFEGGIHPEDETQFAASMEELRLKKRPPPVPPRSDTHLETPDANEPPPREESGLEADVIAAITVPPPSPPPPPTPLEDDTEVDSRLSTLLHDLQKATEGHDRPLIIELLGDVVSLTEEFGQIERAFQSMVRLANIDPTRQRLDEVVRLGRKAGAFDEMIATVAATAEKLGDDAALEYGLLLAKVEIDDCKDLHRGMTRLEGLYALAPDDERIFDRLIDVVGQADRHEEQVRLLFERSGRIENSRAWDLIRRAVQITERDLQNPQAAAEYVATFAERAPEITGVRAEGAAILERARDWEALVGYLSEGLGRLEGEERADMRLRIASIHEEHLDNLAAAEKMLRLGLEERARDERLLSALERITASAGRWEDVVDARIRRLDVIEDPTERIELRRDIARIAERQLDRGGARPRHVVIGAGRSARGPRCHGRDRAAPPRARRLGRRRGHPRAPDRSHDGPRCAGPRVGCDRGNPGRRAPRPRGVRSSPRRCARRRSPR